MGSQPLLAIIGLLTSPSPSVLDLSQRITRGRMRETRECLRLRVGAGARPQLGGGGGSTYIGSATASVLVAAAVGSGGSAAGDGSGESGAAAAGGGGGSGTVVMAAGGADCLGDTSW
jgi:hypothetical protein